MAKRTVIKQYRSYSFVDKDPIIDSLRTAVSQSGKSYLDIHEASDVSVSTLYNWFNGPTRRPTHACVAAVGRALGHEGYNWKRKKFINGAE